MQVPWQSILRCDPTTFRFEVTKSDSGYELAGTSVDLCFALPIPAHLYPGDLPTWFGAMQTAKAKPGTLSDSIRVAWQERIGLALGLHSDTLTIWLANPAKAGSSDVYHIRFDAIRSWVRTATRVTIEAPIEDFRFAPETLRQWNFSVWFTTIAQAEAFVSALAEGQATEITDPDRKFRVLSAASTNSYALARICKH